jgi:hypothetical protein
VSAAGWSSRREPPAVFRGHQPVLRGPHHEYRAAERPVALRPFQQHVAWWDAPAVGLEVPPHRGLLASGPEPLVHDLVGYRSLAHPAPPARRPPGRAEAQQLGEEREAAGHARGEGEEAAGNARRVVVERLARDEHHPRHPLGAAVGDEDLRAAPVVLHERDVVQVELLQELPDQHREPSQRQVRVRPHGTEMRAQRQVREHAAVLAAQLGDDVAPLRRRDGDAVHEDEDGAAPAGVGVLDRAGRELDLRHQSPKI